MYIIAFLVFGLIVGIIARLIVPGRDPGGWIMSIVIGIAGSFVGGFIGRVAGIYQHGQAAGWLMSILGAVLLLLAYHAVIGRRGAAT
jgi:uncharacterized membrane protein YeaQ/YmgE (transglycosylase-associated protein family)